MTTTPAATTASDATAPPLGLMVRAVALDMLRDLYSQLPAIDCKGLCHDSCTAIDASQLERDVLAEHGVTLPDTTPLAVIDRYQATGHIDTCPALSPFGRCTVYEVRPFVCRAFGAVSHRNVPAAVRFAQAMMCQHGCEPEFTIGVKAFMQIMCEIEALSRAATGIARAPIPGDSPALLARFRGDNDTGHRVGHDVNKLASAAPRKTGKGRGRGRGGGRT